MTREQELEQRYQDFQEWLNICPLVVTDYQDFTDQFQITFFFGGRLMTLTKVETQQLVDEFIEFQVNEMTNEEMTSYISNHLRQEINQSNDDIKKQIDDYDEYLYKILVDYIQDKPMSYEILQEFIHERQEQWCYE